MLMAGFGGVTVMPCADAVAAAQRTRRQKKMEPAGGFDRSVSRLQFGRSAIELHRLKNRIGPVPGASQRQKSCNYAFGENLEQAAMQLERDAHPAERGQRDVVPRHAELLETVS